jgi:hypothetical protein
MEREEIESNFSSLKENLSKVKAPRMYKSVKGDKVDELFAKALNEAGIDLPVKRIQEGKYLFGSKNITCRIINGKLVVRVGGGY